MTAKPLPEQLHDAIARVGELIEQMREEQDSDDLRFLETLHDEFLIEYHRRLVTCSFERMR